MLLQDENSLEPSSMKDKFFLDTNIFVYSFDRNSQSKSEKSQFLIKTALDSANGIISFQVIQEFLNVSISKFKNPLTITDARKYLENVLFPLCEVFPSFNSYRKTMDLKEKTNYSFYDCLILSAALEADCKYLISEDFDNNRKFGKLTIINPYTKESQKELNL